MPSSSPAVEIEVDDRVVRVSNPDRVYFPPRTNTSGATKLDLVEYYLAVGDGIVNALFERPCMLHRFPKGLAGDKVHQKRLPAGAPPWVETVRLHFPRWNRTADELCVTELGSVIWAVQMSTVEFHPWNSRRAGHREARRVADRPRPRPAVRLRHRSSRVAHVAHEVLDELGATGFPKTSGGKGLHIYVRIPPDHGFKEVRRAALAFAREVERRAPDDVTTSGGARTATRTTCSSTTTRTPATTPSPRRTPCAASPTPGSPRRSAGTRSTTSTRATSRSSRSRRGTPSSATCTRDIDDHVFDIAPLLEWADRDERDGRRATRRSRRGREGLPTLTSWASRSRRAS